ncbi:hypothetical protein [Clostridium isatidis]|uniref:hypothetical protein n=1 Tax=Clostridium isatidis TaxID=182773 RepID=UPI0013E0B577|nr:hypothetical protein [Clostridium isatidis]NLZ35795.1 hypothetical protein [Clostridiales bacterium]
MTKKGTLSSIKEEGNLNNQVPKDTYSIANTIQDQKRSDDFTKKLKIERESKENQKK